MTKAATYENGLPVEGGLLDQRMGVTDHGLLCVTCKMGLDDCPGHFGCVKLAEPVVHVGYAKTIHNILRCVCYNCSRLLLDPSKNSSEYKRIMRIKNPKNRLNELAKACAGLKCGGGGTTEAIRKKELQDDGMTDELTLDDDGNPIADAGTLSSRLGGCGHIQPSYRRVQFSFTREFKQQKPKKKKGEEGASSYQPQGHDQDMPEQSPITAREIEDILSKISDNDIGALGFNATYAHPKWLITTYLPVPPPHVRPSVTFNGTDRSSDDITVALSKIIQINNSLKNQSMNLSTSKEKDIERLTLACAQLVNNEMSNTEQMTSKSGKVLKTLRQRLVGKGGRIRSNLMGKRVNFCGRTVITGDPNLGIDYVGVPRWIAKTLTYPEVVTNFNRERLQKLVQNGAEQYPGANTVIKPDGTVVHLRQGSQDVSLSNGYIVERHIIDEDFILFNRQPSLHKMSLMGHKAKVMPYSSFRLNLSCTSPYNADFDGDEMNLHVAQTPMLRAEVAEIMLSPRQVVSPQASRPVMSIVQDSLLGVSKFTRRDTFCDRNLTNNLLMCIDTWEGEIPQPAILKPMPLWTGKQLFSLIIPTGLNLVRGSKHKPDSEKDNVLNISPSDARVLISNGQLIKGIIDANTVGKTAGGLIHIIWLEKGWDATRLFMTQCQKLVNNWLATHGFSVGIADLVASAKTIMDVKALIQQSEEKVEQLIDEARSGRMERKPGHSIISTFEVSVNQALNQAISNSGKAVQSQLSRDNAINAMVYAGSKGSHLNISQIVACVGQQNVSQKRVAFTFRRRTLPHFLKENVGAASRGFVASSYMKGLNPTEFMMHACLATQDHQILTNKGYLFAHEIEQYNASEDAQRNPLLFAQYCQNTAMLSYAPASNWIHRPLAQGEEMYAITCATEVGRWVSGEALQTDVAVQDNNGVAFLVTGNHDMWLQPYSADDAEQLNTYQKIRADELLQQEKPQFKFAGYAPNGLSPQGVPTPRQNVVDAYTALSLTTSQQQIALNEILGSWLGQEGSTLSESGALSFSPSSNTSHLTQLFTTAGLVKEQDFTAEGACVVSKPEWVALFGQCGQKEDTKCMPSWYCALTKEEGRALLTGLNTTTTTTESRSATIVTSSCTLRDEIVILAAHCGYSASFTANPTNNTWIVSYTDCEATAAPIVDKSAVTRSDYSGAVFCVTVPTGLIITRRARAENGVLTYASRPMIVGNCGGREGLVDTAVKTAETGYIQRRLVKSMESIKVHYDATVRNSLGDIIQFVYGEDGMDGCYIEQLQIDYMGLDNDLFKSCYYFNLADQNLIQSTLLPELSEELLENNDARVRLRDEFKQLKSDRDDLRALLKIGTKTVYLPCNIPRIITNAQQQFGIKLEGGIREDNGVIRLDLGSPGDLSPLYVLDQVEALSKRLIVISGNSALSREAQDNATRLFKIYVRHALAAKRVLGEYHLTKQAFDVVVGEIESRFKQALVHPGEMVGAIAAQSIGEPATQMTLNTFHMAGYSAKNVTSGVPRLVEIINVATNVKASGMDIELRDKEVATNKELTNKVLTTLEYTRVCDITEAVEIYHDPNPTECCIPQDAEMVQDYLQFAEMMKDDSYDYSRSNPWLIRIKLSNSIVIGKGLAVSNICNIINQHFASSEDQIKCIGTESVTSDNQVLHIRSIPRSSATDGESYGDDMLLKFTESLKNIVMNNIKLCGITGITKIFLDDKPVKYYDKDTGLFVQKEKDQPGSVQYYLQTEGTNLKEVIIEEAVDHTTCYSNFCPDMLGVFGIEATRASVLKELRGVIEADGSYISYRHIAMLVDIMTFKGALMSITRNGFNRLDTGPLMRCSFEESVEILMDAAAFSSDDPLDGISEKVMTGQLANIGTGSFDIVLNVRKLLQTQKEAQEAQVSAMNNQDTVYNIDKPINNLFDGGFIGPLDVTFDAPTSAAYAPSKPYTPNYPSPTSGNYSPTSANYSTMSPNYTTSANYSPQSSVYNSVSSTYSPTASPGYQSPSSPGYQSPSSPGYTQSPNYSSSQSPNYSPTSSSFSPTSPSFSPGYTSPVSPSFQSPTSPAYASPQSPTSPAYNGYSGYSPQSPSYQSPGYSPTSPSYSAASPDSNYSPSSPGYED